MVKKWEGKVPTNADSFCEDMFTALKSSISECGPNAPLAEIAYNIIQTIQEIYAKYSNFSSVISTNSDGDVVPYFESNVVNDAERS
jgi:hypothetical protein